jgi:P27 family predicted phage terminase small subunit
MRTGRKPKPFLLKLAEGNRGRRKLSPGVDLPAGPFDPPFPLDGIALREWERIIAAAYWLRETDSVAVADRCLCFQRLLEAEQDIRDRGTIVRTRNGKVTNPSIRIARAYRISIQRYDSELGLTASSRGRVDGDGSMPNPPKQPGKPMDPLERALCGNLPN